MKDVIDKNEQLFDKYGNINKGGNLNPIKQHIYSGLKLHYSISGVVEQNDNLLD
jgi:hypothetical protein